VGLKQMSKSQNIVRLFAAFSIAIVACYFVQEYSSVSGLRFFYDHQGAQQRDGWALIDLTYARFAYILPIGLLCLGGIIIWRLPQCNLSVEIVLSALWMFSFIWSVSALIIWQWANIPMYSHGTLHF
jgi:hypothetical protein